MILVFIFSLLFSYIICIIYVKHKMKIDADSIISQIKNEVDKKNLNNLVKFSEKKLNPENYNSNIVQYQEEIALYTGRRALISPKETFEDFCLYCSKLLMR